MVQLIKLEMEGFGKFAKEKPIDFDEGINFIIGLNEAGKSTVLEAISASIFKYTKAQIEPFICWNNNETCRTVLTYRTDKADIFKIISDYKSGKRRLEKIENGRMKEIATIDKNINPFLKEHFGFDDKKVFENTAFIRQSHIAILEDNSVKNKIKDMIEKVFAGSAESSATKALAKMNQVAKDYSKQIDNLEEEKVKFKEKLESVKKTRGSVAEDSGELKNIGTELDDKIIKLENLEQNKKLFYEKDKLSGEDKHLNEQIKKVDELIETLSSDKEVSTKPIPDKTIGIILTLIGILISLTGIGAAIDILLVIGIPLVIWGLIKLLQKEEKRKPVQKDNEKLQKYLTEKNELINKKAIIEKRFEEYKLVNFNINDFNELETLKKEVDTLRSRKVELQTSIRTTTTLVESPEEVKEELDSIEENQRELNKKIEEYKLAAHFLELAESEVHHKFTPMIEKNSKQILKEITNERYSDLKIEEDTLNIKIKEPEAKEYIDVSYLSQGTKDQLYFTLRTVMSDLLSGDTNIPLILDDPFHNFDNVRLAKTINMINELAKNKQIILISHRPYHQEVKNFTGKIIELN
ncbi:MAG: DNA double-strand break repair Rad50 ATPase [Candidatus Methanoperedens nitroreducens]|uniref:DNA double-strand break repair Rad50 ATPase n=1 Tax=Candidatus Methanoperedens nitratireducens TaxID=1392998 RepID=A0A0P8DVY4_9EURY|nr:AAA family ATPase [Candidatus Methanoperedens sp. BLZ2]KAB2944781.1 MAG: AAA family ATPase [Candidatus Methanoperedens sp.]KPQ41718.1 MAG: DNA double-strand break repair Rad50 ATPase [Candidatus Methanoperedens sp. BLZ1]MBZ0177070.1 AAA family ATPase [Candidatus Methanoperedens nitroreducens]MCX9077501.1 AAA family ATPase [Candidatus Methanoperedens sp.]